MPSRHSSSALFSAPRRGREASRRVLAGAVLLGTGVAGVQPALAAELVAAELVGTQNVVEVVQGASATFTISLSAVDKAACGSTHTAKVKNAFSISGAPAPTVTSGDAFSPVVGFAAPGTGTNCDITGGGNVSATVGAARDTPVGTYTATLSNGAGTTVVTSSNQNGGKLADTTATTLTFRVVAPANTAPAGGNAPTAADGVEGSTLTTSGSFTDVDGNLASVAVTSGPGTLTADLGPGGKPSGSWSWSLPTSDQTSGTVTVTATDAGGLTATQTFAYGATNVAPRVTVAASDATGTEGQTLAATGTFADVAGDTLTITRSAGDGTVVDNRDGTWTWSLDATNETSGTVTVEASDGDGGTQTDTFEYSAANVAPGVRTAAVDAVGNEGSTLTAAGAFSDVPADRLTITSAGAGELADRGDGTWSWSLAAADDASGTVTVTATDGVAGGTDEFTYTVRNVAPAVAVAAGDATGDEGTLLTSGGTFADVAADALTITKVSGPGAVVGRADGTWTWSLEGTDDLTEDVVVKAVDGDGGEQTDTFAVTVRNAAPIVVASAADATGSEGNTLVTSGRFADVPADALTITQTSGAGTLAVGADGRWSWSLGTTDQTSGTVEITATDDDGGTITDTFEYRAVDVAPQLVDAADDATGVEGDTLTASGAFADVAADAIRVVQVSGPGTVTDLGGGAWSYRLPTTDQVSGTVEVKAVDKDGTESVVDAFTVTATNVAPAVGAAGTSQSGSEGGTLTTSGSFTDVAADAITITQRSGDGAVTDHGDGTWSWSLATTDDAAGTVVLEADDGDLGVTTTSFTYAAGNVAPSLSTLTVTGNTGTACVTGNTVTVRFTVTDPGSADTLAGAISWGDGRTTPFTGRTVEATHAYAPGVYSIGVTVSDDDRGAAAPRTASVARTYAMSAIQAPYNADGTSVFKYGSVAPVKVRITDCTNTPVAGLAPTVTVALASSSAPTAAVNETPDSVSAADTTGVLRFDPASGSYVYNLATKSLSDGDARYTVTVAGGGSRSSQGFGLRSK